MRRTSKVATAAKKVVSKGKSLTRKAGATARTLKTKATSTATAASRKVKKVVKKATAQCRCSAGREAWTSRRQRDRPGHRDGREGCQRSDKEVTYKGYTIQAAPHMMALNAQLQKLLRLHEGLNELC